MMGTVFYRIFMLVTPSLHLSSSLPLSLSLSRPDTLIAEEDLLQQGRFPEHWSHSQSTGLICRPVVSFPDQWLMV